MATIAFNPFSCAFSINDLSKPQIIFHDQHHFIVRLNIISVIAGFIDHFIHDIQVRVFNTFIGNPDGIQQVYQCHLYLRSTAYCCKCLMLSDASLDTNTCHDFQPAGTM